MRVSAHGIDVRLPDGWEGRIDGSGRSLAPREGEILPFGAQRQRTLPVAHLATFSLPGDRGDFGSGAVELMSSGDAFVALLEYGPESVGTALFTDHGMPRRLRADQFSPRALQRTLPGLAGFQAFFNERERAFCLYAVLGGSDRRRLVGEVNRTLASVAIAAAS